MADFTKVRRNLPAPPTATEAGKNLAEPEQLRVDGRTLRATGRTMAMGIRVDPEWHTKVRVYAAAHRLKMVEVLERAFALLEQKEP